MNLANKVFDVLTMVMSISAAIDLLISEGFTIQELSELGIDVDENGGYHV